MPVEKRDMSRYATKSMLWKLVPSMAVVVSLVTGAGFTMTATHVSKLLQSNAKIYEAINDDQNKQAAEKGKRIKRLEGKQEQDHEMIKNVESRLTGIESALEFLVEKAKRR